MKPVPLSPRDAGVDAAVLDATAVSSPSTSSANGGTAEAGVNVDALLQDGGISLGIPSLSDASLDPIAVVGNGRSVRFGVVLVSFQGAQGASDKARSKPAAQELADKLAEEAKTDFHAAVTKGDPGSMDDAGRISRGVLEAPAESALFGLQPGTVSGVIETPRGFWIVKRLD
jgi:hypothetical protein